MSFPPLLVKLGAPAWNVSTRRNGLRPETRRWDVLGWDRDEIRDTQVRDQDETETLVILVEMRRWYISRPRCRDPRPHPCILLHNVWTHKIGFGNILYLDINQPDNYTLQTS